MTTIFVHGLGQTSLSWQSTISYLPNQMEVACPDLYKLCSPQDFTYTNLYAAFVAYCNKFSQPINLCGISLGAILALNYAIDFPDRVNSLVLIAAQFKMPRLLLMCQNMIFRMIPEKSFLKSGVKKKTMIQLSQSMVNLDFNHRLQQINCPTLVVCGDKDRVNQKAAKILVSRLINARHQLVDNAGHEVNVQAPQSLAFAIGKFYTHFENINCRIKETVM